MKKHICAIINIKGGTSKTITCGALSELAARDGKRTLAIDFDPQGALSVWYDVVGATQTVYNIFSGGGLPEAIRPTAGGFDIIPSSGNLVAVERVKPAGKRTGETIGQTLRVALDPIKKNYDAIFIDCPPTMGNLQNNAIFAANEIICPLEADIASIRGFLTVIDIVQQAKQSKRNLKIVGALIGKYDGRPTINRDLRDMIIEEAAAAKIPYLGEIRQTVKIREAVATRTPLYQYAPKATASVDYARVYKEIFEN